MSLAEQRICIYCSFCEPVLSLVSRENIVLQSVYRLTLRSLSLNDTGNYICTAYNLIEGSTRQDSVTVLVTVGEWPE